MHSLLQIYDLDDHGAIGQCNRLQGTMLLYITALLSLALWVHILGTWLERINISETYIIYNEINVHTISVHIFIYIESPEYQIQEPKLSHDVILLTTTGLGRVSHNSAWWMQCQNCDPAIEMRMSHKHNISLTQQKEQQWSENIFRYYTKLGVQYLHTQPFWFHR